MKPPEGLIDRLRRWTRRRVAPLGEPSPGALIEVYFLDDRIVLAALAFDPGKRAWLATDAYRVLASSDSAEVVGRDLLDLASQQSLLDEQSLLQEQDKLLELAGVASLAQLVRTARQVQVRRFEDTWLFTPTRRSGSGGWAHASGDEAVSLDDPRPDDLGRALAATRAHSS